MSLGFLVDTTTNEFFPSIRMLAEIPKHMKIHLGVEHQGCMTGRGTWLRCRFSKKCQFLPRSALALKGHRTIKSLESYLQQNFLLKNR